MHLFRPAVRRLVSLPRYTRPHHLLSRPHLHHHQQPISSLLPLRLCSNSATTDGLRNNRDLAQSQASLSSHDATLLSQLSHTPEGREDVPAYAMVFTCKACGERSAHRVSKQAYHHGTVLITCPGCKKRHLMADHLKIFSDKTITLEDILAQKGDVLKKAIVNESGDLEFLDDAETKVDVLNAPKG